MLSRGVKDDKGQPAMIRPRAACCSFRGRRMHLECTGVEKARNSTRTASSRPRGRIPLAPDAKAMARDQGGGDQIRASPSRHGGFGRRAMLDRINALDCRGGGRGRHAAGENRWLLVPKDFQRRGFIGDCHRLSDIGADMSIGSGR